MKNVYMLLYYLNKKNIHCSGGKEHEHLTETLDGIMIEICPNFLNSILTESTRVYKNSRICVKSVTQILYSNLDICVIPDLHAAKAVGKSKLNNLCVCFNAKLW